MSKRRLCFHDKYSVLPCEKLLYSFKHKIANHVSLIPDAVYMNVSVVMDDDGVCTTVPGPCLSLPTSDSSSTQEFVS